jgi:DNA gyrase subunit B
MAKFVDDKYQHLESDVDKLRQKFRMYISFSNELAAKSIVLEILYNAIDECENPLSPADTIQVEYDERNDTIKVTDNGRGIPTAQLEKVLTTLNSGSNIDSGAKASLKARTLGRNGTGTLAFTALSERMEIFSYRGGTENLCKHMIFEEGRKVFEEVTSCDSSKHGLTVYCKPSKILGKSTRIVWDQIYNELVNLQFQNNKKIKMSSIYIDKKGIVETERYVSQPFESILVHKNDKSSLISDKIMINISGDDIQEEVGGKVYNRFIDMDIAFVYTNNMTPYIDSFCNSNNTIDNGSHLDGALEGICRYFQTVTKNSLSDRERDKLDVKWDDVKSGLSIAINLGTNMEEIFTSQTKHKILNEDFEKMIKDKTVDSLQSYFTKNPSQLRELINIVKMNAKVRREGDKIRNAVIKESITNWSSYKMDNYDPCTNRGKEYKELYIIEGKSAKGSLKQARDPKFQALFAIRGVSANVFKMDLDAILKNTEFKNLITVMGCNVGSKFDLSKLQFDKIVIATDADVDGLFIRSLLCSFFIKVFPEIILDGRLFIAEPPLYRVDDKKNPFVINREDYINRYITAVVKEYQLSFYDKKLAKKGEPQIVLGKSELKQFLADTSSYVEDVLLLARHYKVHKRLIEIIFHELAGLIDIEKEYNTDAEINDLLKQVDIQHLMTVIGEDFDEIVYDDNKEIIKGIIDGKYQSMELSQRLVRKGINIIKMIRSYSMKTISIMLKHTKTGAEHILPLMTSLEMLKKFQPDILHRFKGLGENNPDDIRFTLMDANTRMLIKVMISDIENDLKVFNVLRGSSPQDAAARKAMMAGYQIPRELLDT